MSKIKVAALAAVSMLATAQAGATDYVFASGNYGPGVTSPNPLFTPDRLLIQSGNTKYFGANFTNATGEVRWSGGDIGLFGGALVTNASLWVAIGDNQLFQSSGGGSFVNTGTFQKNGGFGTTYITVPFINSGQLDAATGTLQFAGGSTFNAGTSFTGTGTNLVNANAAFNGAIASTNLDLAAGTFTGTAAVLSGSADWNSGNIAGSWTIATGATLNATTGSSKFITGTFATNGTVAWSDGDIGLYGGAAVVNNGTWQASGDHQLYQSSGGGTFTNNGLFQKSGGAGATYITTPFVNNGQLDAASGTIQYAGSSTFNSGTSFTGTGVNLVTGNAAFNGAISSTNLDLATSTFTGTGAALSGTADWNSGNLAGSWTINAGATLNAATGSTKFVTGSFTNAGTVAWSDGDIGLYGGGSVVNNATWQITGDHSLYQASGGGTFTNNALFRKSGGTGTTVINTPFVNNGGQIDAATGTIRFSSPNAVFNTGTSFTGAGTNLIAGNAAFNGAISSANLDLSGGTYTGTGAGATLSGTADWLGGNIAGTWTVASGATLNAATGSTKFVTGNFTNAGTVAWSNGDIGLYAGGTVVNDATWRITGDNSLYQASGGGTFINNALFQKSGGTGTTAVNTPFINNGGQIDAATGTIQFTSPNAVFNSGTSFTGAGTNLIAGNAAFNGAFSSTNLDLSGGTYTGTGAVLSGSADWLSGSFAGTWTVGGGATLNASTGATKFITGGFTNAGTVAWSGGDIGLFGGAAVANTGTITATGDNSVYQASGGGALANSGLIQKTGGTGTTDLSSANLTNTGTIDVRSGTIALPGNFTNTGTLAGTGAFRLSGALTNNGTIAPGAGGAGLGTLQLNGSFQQGTGGFYNVTLGSHIADLFNISGTAALNGGLRLYCSSCAVTAGDVFTILDSVGDLSGMFSTSTAFGFNTGFAYSVLYDTTLDRVQLRIDNAGMTPGGPAAVPEPMTWTMLILGFAAIGAMLRRGGRRAVGPTLAPALPSAG